MCIVWNVYYFYLLNPYSRFYLEVAVGSEMNELFPREEKVPFTQIYFFEALKVEAIVITLIACFGVVYELYNRRDSVTRNLKIRTGQIQLLKQKTWDNQNRKNSIIEAENLRNENSRGITFGLPKWRPV